MRVGPNCAELSTLLNEIDVPHYEAAVITDLSTESGSTLLNGLPKDAPLLVSAYLPTRMVTLILSRQARDSVPPLFDPRIPAGWLLLRMLTRRLAGNNRLTGSSGPEVPLEEIRRNGGLPALISSSPFLDSFGSPTHRVDSFGQPCSVSG